MYLIKKRELKRIIKIIVSAFFFSHSIAQAYISVPDHWLGVRIRCYQKGNVEYCVGSNEHKDFYPGKFLIHGVENCNQGQYCEGTLNPKLLNGYDFDEVDYLGTYTDGVNTFSLYSDTPDPKEGPGEAAFVVVVIIFVLCALGTLFGYTDACDTSKDHRK